MFRYQLLLLAAGSTARTAPRRAPDASGPGSGSRSTPGSPEAECVDAEVLVVAVTVLEAFGEELHHVPTAAAKAP